MLKYLLISPLALDLLWAFQISTQITTISDLGEALITLDLDARTTLLKICINLIILSTILEVIRILVFLMRYGMFKILR